MTGRFAGWFAAGVLCMVTAPAAAEPLRLVGEEAGEGFGSAVGMAGDLDGDGFGDLVVAAPAAAAGAGRVYVYAGGPPGVPTEPTTRLLGNEGQGFGADVAAAGDVDGDGYADLLIVAGDNTAYLHLGGAGGIQAEAAVVLPSGSWAPAGDVDGDGHTDLVVLREDGSVALYRGQEGDFAEPVDVDNGGLELTGLSPAGDVDDDGYDDVVARGFGEASLLRGAPTGLGAAQTFATDLKWRTLVGPAGDVDADGFDDVWVRYGVGGFRSMDDRLRVYHGGAAGLTAGSEVIEADCKGSELQTCMVTAAAAGDVRADGRSDLLLTLSTDGGFEPDPAYNTMLWSSQEAGWSSSYLEGEAEYGDGRGTALAGNGDLNGDGAMDYALGAPGGVTEAAGFVDVFYGVAADADGDGVPAGDDCDDADPGVGAATAWFPDTDADGFGDLASATWACTAPSGTVADSTDCDDGDPGVNPGATETCDGVDEDCDGTADEAACDTGDPQPDSGEGDGDDDAEACGCATSGGGSAFLLVAAVFGLKRRR